MDVRQNFIKDIQMRPSVISQFKRKLPLQEIKMGVWITIGLLILLLMIWDLLSPTIRKLEKEQEESRRQVYEKEYQKP